jgi:fibronectin type III domain protein
VGAAALIRRSAVLSLALAGMAASPARAAGAVLRPPAAPSHLTAQVLSPVEVELFWKDEAADATEVRVEVRTIDGVFEDVGAVSAHSAAAILQGLNPATRYAFRVRAGRLGVFSAYSNETEAVTRDAAVPCAADARTLCLKGGRFRFRVSWSGADGLPRSGFGAPFLAGDSGLFWFFEPDNLELVVKVLDACAVQAPGGGRYWVFAGPATNLQYVLTVTDTRTGSVRVYFHPRGAPPIAVTDTDAFSCL